MGFFANLTAKLSINTSQFNRGLRAASAASTRFSKQVAKDFKAISKDTTDASNSFKIFGDAADKGYKSVKRIAQGIIVSQAFYRFVHAIQNVTKELYNFSQAVEETRVAFIGLIGDADKAKRFNDTLQDLAADTPFVYEQVADNARMLLAYEFPLQNMERIMRSIADATAASGKVESYRNISEALGQIQAKGKLTARELIRLANAGIPAYQILREELGMTHEQISNLGKAPVTADIAIPAILRGMEKRYAGAAAAMQRTTKGLANAIKENLLIISQDAFDPMYQNFRVNMERISNRLEAMRDDIRKGGFGYMLANMFPPEIVQKIQLFVANIQMFIQNIVAMYKSLAPVRHAFTELFLNTFNAVMPFINMFTRILAVLIQMLTSNSTAVRIFVSALGGLFIVNAVIKLILGFTAALKSLLIVKVIAQGIVYLGKAIGFLTGMLASNPLAAFVGIAVGGLLAMTLASKKFGNTVGNLMGKISSAFGVDPSKIFAPKMEENTKIADEFNQELELSSEGLKKMGDKAKEAGKKAKEALMSFDEVFTLPNLDKGAEDLDDVFDIPDIEMPTIPPFDASEMFPDVGASITEWTQGIADTIAKKLQQALIGAGIGATIGGIIGAIFGKMPGAVLGAKIGAAAGAIAGLFWEELVKFFKSPTGKGAGIGAVIGGIIGAKLGGPIGAAVGAILGGTAGGIVGRFWKDIKNAFSNHPVGATIGGVIGAIIGTKLGGPIGTVAGGILGTSAGILVSNYWEDIKDAFSNHPAGATIGGVIGAIVGAKLGGPIGAAAGGTLGASAGMLVSKYWENIKDSFLTHSVRATVGGAIGAAVGAKLGTILAPGAGTVIGAAIGGITGLLVNFFWSKLSSSFDKDNSHERIAKKVAKSFSKISEEAKSNTRVKVNDILSLYTELGEKSYDKLYRLYLNNTKLTEESWSDLKELTREEQQGFLDLLNTHKQEELELIAKAHQTGIITAQSNADELTQAIVNKYDERAEATRVAFERINSVIETSYNDHGILTLEALEEISGIYAQHNKDIIGEATEHNAEWLGIEAVAFRNLAELDNAELDARLKRVQDMFEEERTALENSNQEKLELINDLYAAQLISADEYKDQIQKVWDEYEEAYTALEEKEAEITEQIISHKESILDKTIEWVENTKEKFEDWKNSVSESITNWCNDTKDKLSTWWEDTKSGFGDWWNEIKTGFIDWKDNIGARFKEWKEDIFGKVSTWASETLTKFSGWWKDIKAGFGDWKTNIVGSVADWYTNTKGKLSGWWSETSKGFSDWWKDSKTGFSTWASDIYDNVIGWFDKMWNKLKNFFEDLKFWKKKAKDEESNVIDSIESTRSSSSNGGTGSMRLYSMDPNMIGHAKGGTFKKEHIARFNEGNKMETILPIENPSAMAKVRQAIFGGEPLDMFRDLIEAASGGSSGSQLQPLYVGTLIADDRSLKELERRMYDIRQVDNFRRGG